MKTSIIIGAVVIGILGGLLLTPVAAGHTLSIAEAAVIVSLLVLALVFFTAKSKTASDSAQPKATTPAPAPAPLPVQPPPAENQAESEIVAFLALLQEKGRLVDFLMEDVAAYEDAEVGAAARVIHQGCRQVLQEYFKISPISDAQEGTRVTLPVGYATDQYRIIGKLAGEPPFTGTLLHKGWKTESVKLPRIVSPGRLPSIAAAEVELK